MDEATKRGWQTSRSQNECHQYMLENQIISDVIIKFPSSGESGSGYKELAAHKYMLVSRSPVFEAMLTGNFKEGGHTVTITDVEPDTFMNLLKHIYYDGAELCGYNVLHVMYAAKKYMLDGFVDKCKDFLENEITASNVCTILSHCIIYEELELCDKCMELLRDHPEEVLQSDDFMGISSEGLDKLVSSDVLSCLPAVDVYKYCVKWAKRKQEGETYNSIRDILGNILNHIQFTDMSASELSDITEEDPDVLSNDELIGLFKYIAKSTDNRLAALVSLGFYVRRFKTYVTRNRFMKNMSGGYYGSSSPNSIGFTIDKPITFIGITMYGMNTRGFTDNVRLQLYNDVTSECLSDTRKLMTYTGDSDPVKLTADKHVMLCVDVKYRVVLHTASPSRTSLYCYGTDGNPSIHDDAAGITFNFINVDRSAYTSTTRGQIPQIICSC